MNASILILKEKFDELLEKNLISAKEYFSLRHCLENIEYHRENALTSWDLNDWAGVYEELQ